MWIMDHLILFRIPNGVKACMDLYEILLEKGEDPKVLLDSLISNVKKDPKSQYSNEHKIKGLLRTISKLSIDKSQFVILTKELLDAKTGPDAKLSVYQFVYKETEDRGILERAKNESAKKIREWAVEKSKDESL